MAFMFLASELSAALDDLSPLLAAAFSWQKAGVPMALATVVETWGSAPRRVGAHMLINAKGEFTGSVSGGCVENDILAQAAEVIDENSPRLLAYGVDDAAAWQAGLPCGGQIKVLVQPVSAQAFPFAQFEAIAHSRSLGQRYTLEMPLPSGELFTRYYEPPLRMAVVGAGHIAQPLLALARMMGFSTLLIDPRAAYATAERFPDTKIAVDWPDNALADWRIDRACAVVVVSHDPKIDDVALQSALGSPAFYIGALGSTRSHGRRLERLAAAGWTEADLARIHGPVGLAIGAANPAEIALSIMAQVIAVWRHQPEHIPSASAPA